MHRNMQLHEEPPTSMVSIEQPTNITDASHRELLYEKKCTGYSCDCIEYGLGRENGHVAIIVILLSPFCLVFC